jgi:hypothetical protein
MTDLLWLQASKSCLAWPKQNLHLVHLHGLMPLRGRCYRNISPESSPKPIQPRQSLTHPVPVFSAHFKTCTRLLIPEPEIMLEGQDQHLFRAKLDLDQIIPGWKSGSIIPHGMGSPTS